MGEIGSEKGRWGGGIREGVEELERGKSLKTNGKEEEALRENAEKVEKEGSRECAESKRMRGKGRG